MNKIKKCFVITLIVALIPMLAACDDIEAYRHSVYR